MKDFLPLGRDLLYIAAIIFLLLAFFGCTTTRVTPACDARVDSALTAAGIPPLHFGKVVFRGPVTLQLGQGNVNTAMGKDKTGQRAQALSTGANSPVTATQKKAGIPWQVYAGGAALLLVLGFYAGSNFKIPWPL